MTVRLYHITLSTGSVYDKGDGEARSFEGHFKAYLRGQIGKNRKRLADFLIPFFQRQVYRELGIRISRSHIRVGFDREQPVLAASRNVDAKFRTMTYCGKHFVAKRLPSQTIPLKRVRRRRPRKRKTSNKITWKKRSKKAKRDKRRHYRG
jgi:hypothetical protein